MFLSKDKGRVEDVSKAQLDAVSGVDPDQVLLLYGVSGSGKTRKIEYLLQENWGYYLLPGGLNLDENRNCGNLYDPRRQEYSKDSSFLWEILRNIHSVVPGVNDENNSAMISEWLRRLIFARHLVFNVFLNFAIGKDQTPANWLKFQKSCRDFDPFETLFRLLLLVKHDDQDFGFRTEKLDFLREQNTLYYCLDEAQCYLDTPTSIKASSESNGQNMMRLICRVILSGGRNMIFNRDLRVVISGTSLKLQKMDETIRTTYQTRRSDWTRVPTKCQTFTDFPLLASDQGLEDLVKERGLLEKITSWASAKGQEGSGNEPPHETSPRTSAENQDQDLPIIDSSDSSGLQEDFVRELLDLILNYGTPLRGRYLWLARYVDRIKERFDEHQQLTKVVVSSAAVAEGVISNVAVAEGVISNVADAEVVISNVAVETMNEGKEHLKQRLSRLRDENYTKILKELCLVVIQSDLLDRATVFENDRDHQMISEAFAVVETREGQPVGILKERLAMEAATEWFREEHWEMYSERIKEYLRFSTNDASSFGKAAEWFLALVRNPFPRQKDMTLIYSKELWNCLHHSDRMTGSEGEKRRRKILETLSRASKDGKEVREEGTRSRPQKPSREPLKLASTHRLVEGQNIGCTYDRVTSTPFRSRFATDSNYY